MITVLPLYPLRFNPILKEKIWGGNKLYEILQKDDKGNIGESWEISGAEGSISEIVNGSFKGESLQWLLENYKEKLVGKKVYKEFGNTFPLLFKFIDAREDLSVQLHPDDNLAKKRHNSFGKTEMWYILDAEKNSEIILGFKDGIGQPEYLKRLTEKTLPEILNSEPAKRGDAFVITPGVIHAIGAGVLLAEIQQTSDITYRIYDWDRPDINGKMRQLHNDMALEAIDYNYSGKKLKYSKKLNQPTRIGATEFFEVNKLDLNRDFTRNLKEIDSFTVYMCTAGKADIEAGDFTESIKKGETILIPAIFSEIKFNTDSATFLEAYIP
jgi:mannose-6-phosphate isomerase